MIKFPIPLAQIQYFIYNDLECWTWVQIKHQRWLFFWDNDIVVPNIIQWYLIDKHRFMSPVEDFYKVCRSPFPLFIIQSLDSFLNSIFPLNSLGISIHVWPSSDFPLTRSCLWSFMSSRISPIGEPLILSAIDGEFTPLFSLTQPFTLKKVLCLNPTLRSKLFP